MTLEKAKLVPKSGEGKIIEFMFNPTQLSFSRSVTWSAGGSKGGAHGHKDSGVADDRHLLPKTNFSKIGPYSLTISNVIFDTYETRQSVRDLYIKKLEAAVNPIDRYSKNPKDKRPPVYHFEWGNEKYIKCVVKTLKYVYEMFLPDGTPVRAKVTLTLQEVDQVTATNTDAQPGNRSAGRSNPTGRK
jgi:Contractile injection system tube protein